MLFKNYETVVMGVRMSLRHNDRGNMKILTYDGVVQGTHGYQELGK